DCGPRTADMYCRHISLANFRNYVRLDLELSPHIRVFARDNQQWQPYLLEALYLLATSRSYRTSAERELVNWHVATSPAFARAAAEVVRHPAPARVEVLLAEPVAGLAAAPAGPDRSGPAVPGTPPAESVR